MSIWVFGGLGQQAAGALVFGNPGRMIWGAIMLWYHQCRGCACPLKLSALLTYTLAEPDGYLKVPATKANALWLFLSSALANS